MHPEITQDKPGKCPICEMRLVPQDEIKKGHKNEMSDNGLGKITVKSYIPLFTIIAIIFITSIAISYPNFTISTVVSSFMAGFFITFAGFKLIDLKGFAEGYSTYDLLAKRFFQYGYIYPFIELFFGFSMIIGLWRVQILWAEVLVMTFSGIGVLLKVMKGERFQCVCLGTFLKVPLTKITLIEDFGMAALALIMLLLI
jgi:hypothetical protein